MTEGTFALVGIFHGKDSWFPAYDDVFLPRRVGNPPGMSKKSGCSTAFLPARVVQALNLKLDDVGSQTQLHPRFNGSFAPDVDAAMDLMSLRFISNQSLLAAVQSGDLESLKQIIPKLTEEEPSDQASISALMAENELKTTVLKTPHGDLSSCIGIVKENRRGQQRQKWLKQIGIEKAKKSEKEYSSSRYFRIPVAPTPKVHPVEASNVGKGLGAAALSLPAASTTEHPWSVSLNPC